MDLKIFLEKFSTTFSIPMFVIKNSLTIMSFNTHPVSDNLIHQLMEPYFTSEHNICVLVTEDYLQCGFIRMPEDEQILVIGPAFPYEPTYRQVEKLVKKMRLDTRQKNEILFWFQRLPIMDMKEFRDMLDTVNYIINGTIDVPMRLSHHVPLTNLNVNSDELDFVFTDLFTEKSEALTLSCIENGRCAELETVFNSLSDIGHLPEIGPNTIRSLKNAFISATAITSRAAVRGGMDYHAALSLSNFYIAKMEKLTLFADIYQLLRTMLMDYTRRVASHQTVKTDSPTVFAICHYIQANLSQKVAINDIAQELHLSNSYISHHFKEKTGMNLTDYICTQKIKEAQFLLETTELPLSMIAERLAFSSQQYFQSIFKKYTGMTPLEYQKKMKHF